MGPFGFIWAATNSQVFEATPPTYNSGGFLVTGDSFLPGGPGPLVNNWAGGVGVIGVNISRSCF